MKRSTLIAIMLFFCATTTWALSVPLNGGFEEADLTEVSNWQTRGPWRFKGGPRLEGRHSAGITTYDALPGDRLVADSGLLVNPSQMVTLRGHHNGEGGKIVGLELVNHQGTVIESVASDELDQTEEWKEFTVCYEAPEQMEAEEHLYVRPYVEVIKEGVRFAVDNLEFVDQPPTDEAEKIEVPLLAKPGDEEDETDENEPEPKPEPEPEPESQPDPNYPNLVKNARLSGVGTPRLWEIVGSESRTAYQPPSSGQAGSISIIPGEGVAGWSTEIPAMDISVPHRISMQPAYSATPTRPVQLVVLVLDYSRTKVYHHSIMNISADDRHFETVLPSLNRLPVKGVTQLTWLADEKVDVDFSLSEPVVKADPHIPNIRPLKPLAVFPEARDVGFFMQIPNRTNEIRPFLTHLKTVTADGASVAYEKRRMNVGPRAVAYFPYKPKVSDEGRYTLAIRVQNADGSHTYKYAEYPFTVSSIDADDRDGGVGVWITGSDTEQIKAAAMAGASWICMDVEYTDLLAGYDFRSRLREVTNSAYRAKARDLKVAVRVKMVGEPEKMLPGTRRQFAEDLTRRLYGGVDRWIVDVPSEEDGGLAAGMAAMIIESQREDIPVMVPSEDSYRLFDPGATTSEELMNGLMSELEELAPDEAAETADESGESSIWPGNALEAHTTDEPETAETPSESDTVETPGPETDAPQAKTPESPVWVFAADSTDDEAAPLAMSQKMTQARSEGAAVVFWKSVKATALVDGEKYATAAWLKLRQFIRDLHDTEWQTTGRPGRGG